MLEKKIYYFLKSYRFDILSSVLAIIVAWFSFSFSQDQYLAFSISTTTIFIWLLIIIYLRLKNKDFYFISLDNSKDKDKWIGSGTFEYSRVNKSFQITQAGAGYIYADCLNWSDYKFEFEFKLRKDCLGAVLRAVNLSNYVMIQITPEGLRPHVRINGGWQAWESKDVDMSFDKKLSFENWYKCQIICNKDAINVTFFKGIDKIFDREWLIPQGDAIFGFQRNDNDIDPVKVPFPINLEYGSAGFRNFGREKALVKNVLLEKI